MRACLKPNSLSILLKKLCSLHRSDTITQHYATVTDTLNSKCTSVFKHSFDYVLKTEIVTDTQMVRTKNFIGTVTEVVRREMELLV